MTDTISWGQLGIMVALAAQTAGIFFWAGSVSRILKDHERRIELVEKKIEKP